MSEEHTPYDRMFNKEPEAVEDLIPNPWEEDEEVPEIETVEEAPEPEVETVETAPEPEVEVVEDEVDRLELDTAKRVRVDTDGIAKLNLRATPSNTGDLIGKLLNGTMLKVLDEANPEWVFIQVEGVDQCGYVKKLYVTEA